MDVTASQAVLTSSPSVLESADQTQTAAAAPRARRPGRSKKASKSKPRCEDCFFFQNELCALSEKKPCPTFREAHPDGLRPPRQLSLAFRIERENAGRQLLPPLG